MQLTDRIIHARPRAGFTAIEMMVVVSIIIVLVAMVVPTIGPAMKKGSVHDAASCRAGSQARQLARSTTEPRTTGGALPKWYGVSVVVPSEANKPAYAVVIYGNTTPSDYGFASNEANHYPNGTPSLDGTGTISDLRAASKFPFNRGVMPIFAASATATTIPSYNFMSAGTAAGWYYQYRTGFVFNDVTRSTVAKDIGVPGGASPEALGVASLDMKYKVAVAVYKIGLLNAQDVN